MHEHIRERKEIPNLCKPNILFLLCKCYTLPHDFYELHTDVLWLTSFSGEMIIYAFS